MAAINRLRRRRSIADIAGSRELFGKRRRQPPADLDRTLLGQMALIELDRNIAMDEFVAAVIAADRIVDGEVSRSAGRYQRVHRPVALPDPRRAPRIGGIAF